jgi:hypothetical protein
MRASVSNPACNAAYASDVTSPVITSETITSMSVKPRRLTTAARSRQDLLMVAVPWPVGGA